MHQKIVKRWAGIVASLTFVPSLATAANPLDGPWNLVTGGAMYVLQLSVATNGSLAGSTLAMGNQTYRITGTIKPAATLKLATLKLQVINFAVDESRFHNGVHLLCSSLIQYAGVVSPPSAAGGAYTMAGMRTSSQSRPGAPDMAQTPIGPRQVPTFQGCEKVSTNWHAFQVVPQ